jgi:hypothetical protein
MKTGVARQEDSTRLRYERMLAAGKSIPILPVAGIQAQKTICRLRRFV